MGIAFFILLDMNKENDTKNKTLLDEIERLRQRVAELEIGEKQREWTEQRLKESQERFQQVAENAREWIWEVNAEGLYTYVSPVIKKILGYEPREIIGKKHFYDLFYIKDQQALKKTSLEVFAKKKSFRNFINRNIHKNGKEVWLSTSGVPMLDQNGKLLGYRGADVDITERRKTQENLSFTQFVIDHMSDAVLWIGSDAKIFYVNDAACYLLGYRDNELMSMAIHDVDTEFPKDMWSKRWEIMRKEKIGVAETYFRTKDGKKVPVEISGKYMEYDSKEYLCAIVRDVTERERVEEALRRSEQEKALILDSVLELIIYHDANMRVLWANKAARESVDLDGGRLLGRHCYEIWHQRKTSCKNCPVRKAFKTGRSEQGEVKLPDGRFWFIRGYPVKGLKGKVVGVVEFALDITEKSDIAEERRINDSRSRRILEETVIALAATAERRDPYTAGHQRRVAQLAFAIAKEMELDKDKIEGMRMAAIIHDVGKVYVPAEILSNPNKLTDVEFNIIRTHSQIGYDILKPVEFPWPVALIVYQHHEKVNGSGYPNGITGKDILLEAKILTVADVVEAMASHRPYRAALGVDKALREISKNKGILYDPEVVSVCVKLFKKKKFKFSQKKDNLPIIDYK